MSSSGPEKFNPDRTDELAREAFSRAAQYGAQLIDDASKNKAIVNFDDRISSLGAFMAACSGAMLFPDKEDSYRDDEI